LTHITLCAILIVIIYFGGITMYNWNGSKIMATDLMDILQIVESSCGTIDEQDKMFRIKVCKIRIMVRDNSYSDFYDIELQHLIDELAVALSLRERLMLHVKMSRAYWMVPPYHARGRRDFEEANTLKGVYYKFLGQTIYWEQITECSTKNVYYHNRLTVNNVKSNITRIKRLLEKYYKSEVK
jgi:hypothetical protein